MLFIVIIEKDFLNLQTGFYLSQTGGLKMKKSSKKKADVTRRKNNTAEISGIIKEEFRFDHTVNEKNMYSTTISNRRLSGKEDSMTIIVSEKLLMKKDLLNKSVKGKRFKGTGEFRSCNVTRVDGSSHLRLYVWLTDIQIVRSEDDVAEVNEVVLDGYLCRTPIYRRTGAIPEDGRDITDIMLSVNRPYGGSDHIPCIVWDVNAVRASFYKAGFRIRCHGRIQSREYFKTLQKGEYGFGEWRKAYEVSVFRMEFLSDM